MTIEEIVETKNLKLTAPRRELLTILLEESRPLSFEDVKHRLKMDKATFYRNVLKFEEESIVNSFESSDKKKYYELQEFPHAHFICDVCNKIECLKSLEPVKLEGYVTNDMIFKGSCKECSE